VTLVRAPLNLPFNRTLITNPIKAPGRSDSPNFSGDVALIVRSIDHSTMILGNPPRWQFSLRHLFELTTLSAIGTALAATFGPGTLVMSIGIILAWMNMRSAFERIQGGRGQATVLCLAWGLFLVSLALPSITVFGPVNGVSSAWIAMAAPIQSLLRFGEMKIGVIVFIAIDVANLLMALLPLLIWKLAHGRGQRLADCLAITMVTPWCIAWDPDNLLVGYYLWSTSMGIALIAIRIRKWIFGGMLAMAATIAAIAWLEK